MRIMLVEDNSTIAKGLHYTFEQNGYECVIASCVNDAKDIIEKYSIDLVVLDVSLPDGNGFELYKEYIKPKKIATIFLTAKDTEDDIVKGFELGAEDYITKPFSTRELLARINRIKINGKKNIIKVKDISLDMDKMQVYKNGTEITLTSLELKILHLLFLNLNKVVTRDYLIESIWNWTGNDVSDNTITVYLKRIREKLGENIIVTVKGIGYRIDES